MVDLCWPRQYRHCRPRLAAEKVEGVELIRRGCVHVKYDFTAIDTVSVSVVMACITIMMNEW